MLTCSLLARYLSQGDNNNNAQYTDVQYFKQGLQENLKKEREQLPEQIKTIKNCNF